jgi:fluoride ion exporter CrcB/FEX
LNKRGMLLEYSSERLLVNQRGAINIILLYMWARPVVTSEKQIRNRAVLLTGFPSLSATLSSFLRLARASRLSYRWRR